MRPDAKKDKAEPEMKHYMSGAKGMLPTAFDIQPISKADRVHQSEKPVELLKQILEFVTDKKRTGIGPICWFLCPCGSCP